MLRVLLTGMSATGKSSLVAELTKRGYKAVDTDDGWCEALPDGRQQWREDAIEHLLDTEDAEVLFVAGCEENQVRFHARFDEIVLLTAPLETVLHRLATRTTNPFGKDPVERQRVVDDVATIEPLLRRVATREVDTTMSLDEVVSEVLHLIGVHPTGGAPARRTRSGSATWSKEAQKPSTGCGW